MKNAAGAQERIISHLKNLDLSTCEAEDYARLLDHPSLTTKILQKAG